ncbi:MAG: hypothetical protein EBQ66_06455 [Flavobacteriia bacterium]|nr:hypothetical protein [Flavobacteriia bacterium]
MPKILKILRAILGVCFEWILILLILFAFLIRTRTFQTYLAKEATAFLSQELNTKISIAEVDVNLFYRVYLNGVSVKDLKGRNLVKIKSLEVLVSDFGNEHLDIQELILDKGNVWVCSEKNEGGMNFQFLLDYFSSDSKSTSSAPFSVTLKKLTLKDTELRFDDLGKKKMLFGLDYNHLHFNPVNLSLTDFENNGPETKFTIVDFSTKDHSGLVLKKLAAKVRIHANGISLTGVQIKLNDSDVFANEVSYVYASDADLEDFNNKVQFVFDIATSTVDLADIAYFVPEMEGMNEKFRISCRATNVLNRLKIKNVDLRIRNHTFLKADLELPNFSNLADFNVKQTIRSAYFDVNEVTQIHLPGKNETLNLGDVVANLGHFQLRKWVLELNEGKLKVNPTEITTAKGSVNILAPFQLDEFSGLVSGHVLDAEQDFIQLKQVQLGDILGEKDLGLLDGTLKLNKVEVDGAHYSVSGIQGKINALGYSGYEYQGIALNNVDLKDGKMKVDLQIKDPNLAMTVNGEASLTKKPNYDLTIGLETANLGLLGYTKTKETSFSGDFTVHTQGTSFDLFEGNIDFTDLHYAENGKDIDVPDAAIVFKHSKFWEHVKLTSSILDFDLDGSMDLATLQGDVLHGFSRVIPSIIQEDKPAKGKVNNKLDVVVKVKDIESFLAIFVPDLSVSKNTNAVIQFNGDQDLMAIQLTSGSIVYDSMEFKDITLNQKVNNLGVMANLEVGKVTLTDALSFNDVSFVTTGIAGVLSSTLRWDQGTTNHSQLGWKTDMLSASDFKLTTQNSWFSINGFKWNIQPNNEFIVENNHFNTDHFVISSDQKGQKIELEGCLSENKNDQMTLLLTNIDLEDISNMLKLDVRLEGKVTGKVGFSDPYESAEFNSDLNVTNLYLDHEEVGNVNVFANYNEGSKSIKLRGDLAYRGFNTMDFSGQYLLDRETDNLVMRLDFKNTDIAYTNAFMDPDVVQKIEGKLNGYIDVKGSPDAPELKGMLYLKNAAADFVLLGCRYTMNGKIIVDKDGFLINKLPISDSEGNIATLDGAVFHTNFEGFNYNLDIDFEEDYTHSRKYNPSGKIDKFMLLNTTYKEGDSYYGKAYGRGTANIAGYGSRLDVTVNMATRKGSKIIFPMYGSSELEDEELIHFVNKGFLEGDLSNKIDFTGVNLDLTFNVTPDAEVRLVFNDQTQDEIKAKAEGRLNLKLNEYNQMNLEGNLSIAPGSLYNFTLGPVRKPFEILGGSSIKWSGDIYNADINVIASHQVKNTNMLELSPETTDKALQKQDAQCLLNLTGTLEKPIIGFEIATPKAPESGKVLINRINEEKDELNRQFFSLMLFSKFQPLRGNLSANESAALDLVESQINSALAQMSKNYQVKMDIGAENVSTSVQKSFINGRLIVSGSFGVQNASTSAQSNASGLVGDVNVEYLVNESGTFRVNAFNRSNTNTVKENSGPFTQGAGLSYHEDFNDRKDLVIWQSFLDVFREKKNKSFQSKRKKRQTKLPSEAINSVPPSQIEKEEKHE